MTGAVAEGTKEPEAQTEPGGGTAGGGTAGGGTAAAIIAPRVVESYINK